jgi:hypothetical protein
MDQPTSTCNFPMQCGPVVQGTEVVGTAPSPQGGTVTPGLYFLTKLNVYRAQAGGPLGTEQETTNFSANAFGYHWYVDGYENPTGSGTYMTSGTTLTRMYSCPTTNTTSKQYTATPTTFTYYVPGMGTDIYEYIESKQ